MNLNQAGKQTLAFLERVTHWQEGTPDLHTVKTDLKQALANAESSDLAKVYQYFTLDQWKAIAVAVQCSHLGTVEKHELLAKLPSASLGFSPASLEDFATRTAAGSDLLND